MAPLICLDGEQRGFRKGSDKTMAVPTRRDLCAENLVGSDEL